MRKFRKHDAGQHHLLEEPRENVDVSDQDQVMDRARIGDNQTHLAYNPKRFSAARSRSKSDMV